VHGTLARKLEGGYAGLFSYRNRVRTDIRQIAEPFGAIFCRLSRSVKKISWQPTVPASNSRAGRLKVLELIA
jgi:hypothetical protein